MDESSQPVFSKSDAATRLAVERTRLAHDRNMMAWIRTAASLITFGFTIDRFFEFSHPAPHPKRLIGPREFAVFLIVLGLAALVSGLLEHRRSLNEMATLYGGMPVRTPARVVAGLVSVLGIGALLAALLRL